MYNLQSFSNAIGLARDLCTNHFYYVILIIYKFDHIYKKMFSYFNIIMNTFAKYSKFGHLSSLQTQFWLEIKIAIKGMLWMHEN